MEYRENEILIIQTSDSSSIIVSKEFFPYDDSDIETLCYSIREGDNPLYWSDCWQNDLLATLNLVEFPLKNISSKRDYISWWLNCRPRFVDESIKPLLKQKLELYYSTGEIKNTFKNAKMGLEFNANCLKEWHELLQLKFETELHELIPQKQSVCLNDSNIIKLFFESFETLPYRSISLNFEKSMKFQIFLDYVYGCLNKEVPAFSYADKWVLYNSTTQNILRKENNSDCHTLEDLGIRANNKIICYKK